MIYFIQAGSEGPIKIGYTLGTINFKHRFRMLQTGNHETLKLLSLVEGSKEDERRIHDRLCKHRVRGEWFVAQAALTIMQEYNGNGRLFSDLEHTLKTSRQPLF